MLGFIPDLIFGFTALVVGTAAALRGAASAGVRLIGLLFAGLLAMNWFEPVSDALGGLTGGSAPLASYRDFGSLLILSAAFFLLIRAVTNRLLPANPPLPPMLETPGRWILGLAAGFVAAAFLLTAVHTFPGDRDFGGTFPPEPSERGGPLMKLAPDYRWLGFTQHVSEHIFRRPAGEDRVFDGRQVDFGDGAKRFATFPTRYAAWREQLRNRGGE